MILRGQLSRSHGGAHKLGFHAIPSMASLHLHLISTDLDSEALKNSTSGSLLHCEFLT